MDTENKFLSEEYISIRMKEFPEIKSGRIKIQIQKSNIKDSKSIYVEFLVWAGNTLHKQQTLRISDHKIKDCVHTQFLIEPTHVLTKKKKDAFIRVVKNCIKKSLWRNFMIEFKKIKKNSPNLHENTSFERIIEKSRSEQI